MIDTYKPTPSGSYETRRADYLRFAADYVLPPDQTFRAATGFFHQISRLELGLPVDEDLLRQAIAFVDARPDCCDFALGGLLRILYKYGDSPLLSSEILAEMKRCAIAFKYWWDEKTGDNNRCYHTENHQIIYHSDELLAAQLFPDATFVNSGEDAAYHKQHALHLIKRWFDFRARFGFSEWLSNCYFEENLLALVNLYDFAEQEEIRHLAKITIDLLMFEMALHSYRGVMGCTHGRTYSRLILGGRAEDAANTIKLLSGMGLFTNANCLGTTCLVTSAYRPPEVFAAIAADLDGPQVFKERHSINIEDAPAYGLSYDQLEDCHLYWSIQDYNHPNISDLSKSLSTRYQVRLFDNYDVRYAQTVEWLADRYGALDDASVDYHALTEVHVQTYRTRDYLLSCAQDFRPGLPGYQQHIWQATLGIDAVLFSNHPGSDDDDARPNFWAGNGLLPRAVQHQNVLVCIHHLPDDVPFPFSHAYFPQAAYDAVEERGPWVFAKKDDGYVALYTSAPGRWLPEKNGAVVERRVDAPDCIWLVEMGDAARWGSFAAFMDAISTAAITVDGLDVQIESPSIGRVTFGWKAALRVAGQKIDVHNYPRFENPYCQAAFAVKQMQIQRGDVSVEVDFSVL